VTFALGTFEIPAVYKAVAGPVGAISDSANAATGRLSARPEIDLPARDLNQPVAGTHEPSGALAACAATNVGVKARASDRCLTQADRRQEFAWARKESLFARARNLRAEKYKRVARWM
jgi:hypothetical protein